MAGDLKKAYTGPTVVSAEEWLEGFAKVWNAEYPTISEPWQSEWTDNQISNAANP
jgi:transposase-like protein